MVVLCFKAFSSFVPHGHQNTRQVIITNNTWKTSLWSLPTPTPPLAWPEVIFKPVGEPGVVRFFPKIRESMSLPGSSCPSCRGFKGDGLGKKRQTSPTWQRCSGVLLVCLTHLLSCLWNSNGNDCVCVLRTAPGEPAQPLSLTASPSTGGSVCPVLRHPLSGGRVQGQRGPWERPSRGHPRTPHLPAQGLCLRCFHSGSSLFPDPFLAPCCHLVLSTDVASAGRPSKTSCP